MNSGPGLNSSLFRAIIAILVLTLMSACGGKQTASDPSSSTSSTGTGSVSFSVEWEPRQESSADTREKGFFLQPMAPAIDVCTDYGINTMTMQIWTGGQTNPLAETSVPCVNKNATLSNVPAGNNLTLKLVGSLLGGGNDWNGFSAPFTLAAGETKEVGKITVSYTGNDNTTPRILSVSPDNNATDVLDKSTIRIFFSEKMAINTVQDNEAFVITDNVSGPVLGTITYNPSDNSASFTPSSSLASGAKVSVTVDSSVQDMAGNKLASARTWSFTVHVSGTWMPPTLVENYSTTNAGFWNSISGKIIDVDAAGNAIVVGQWTDASRIHAWSNRYDKATKQWGAPHLLENDSSMDVCCGYIDVNAGGNAVAVWGRYDFNNQTTVPGHVFTSRFDNTTKQWDPTPFQIETTNAAGLYYQSPSVVMDDIGNATIVWQHYYDDGSGLNNHIFSRNFNAQTKTWGVAGDIDNGIQSNNSGPMVAGNKQGTVIAAWMRSDNLGTYVMSNLYTPGVGWGTAVPVSTSSVCPTNPWLQNIVIDEKGDAIVAWNCWDGNSLYHVGVNRFDAIGMTWDNGTYLSNSTDNALTSNISVDGSGNAFVVWLNEQSMQVQPWACRFNATSKMWEDPIPIGGTSIFPSSPPQIKIAMNADGHAVAAWTQSDGTVTNIWANLYVPGTAWSAASAILLENENAGNAVGPSVAIDGSGIPFVVWRQSDGTYNHVWATWID